MISDTQPPTAICTLFAFVGSLIAVLAVAYVTQPLVF